MTEAEWLECTDLQKMVDFLVARNQGSARKCQLFLCACVRRIWHLLTEEHLRFAVELAEQRADGLITDQHIEDAWLAWIDAGLPFRGSDAEVAALAATGCSVKWDFEDAHQHAVCAATGVQPHQIDAGDPAVAVELKAQNHLLRCIMGTPFRPQPIIDPSVLAWSDRAIPRLAQAIYDERAFDRLPILADAFEDAGCTNADILNHCRSASPHARGCWCVDAVLGKS
jgi:hypothetical protein